MLREDGKLIATTRFDPVEPAPANSGKNPAAASKDYVRRHWRYQDPAPESRDLVERARSHSLCISGMAFQDAWNIDLERLKRCCVHVAGPGNKLVPFCVYYLTSTTGSRLIQTLNREIR